LLPNGLYLLGTYHPSLRNTNTGRLNAVMFTRIFVRARELAGLDGPVDSRRKPTRAAKRES
jgi:hypothetical protein